MQISFNNTYKSDLVEIRKYIVPFLEDAIFQITFQIYGGQKFGIRSLASVFGCAVGGLFICHAGKCQYGFNMIS